MKTIELENLPEAAEVVGFIYDDPDMIYESGDVLCVKLPNGAYVDLGWDNDDEVEDNARFVVTVWTGYFGNDIRVFRCDDRHDAALTVAMFARDYAEYSTDDLIAAAVANDPYILQLHEACDEVDRLYSWVISYAFLCTMGGIALMLALCVKSDFARYVLMTMLAPCFVACQIYAVRLQMKVNQIDEIILKRSEDA